jgi:hypothetical protein
LPSQHKANYLTKKRTMCVCVCVPLLPPILFKDLRVVTPPSRVREHQLPRRRQLQLGVAGRLAPHHRLSPCSPLGRCRSRPLGQALGDAHEIPTRVDGSLLQPADPVLTLALGRTAADPAAAAAFSRRIGGEIGSRGIGGSVLKSLLAAQPPARQVQL